MASDIVDLEPTPIFIAPSDLPRWIDGILPHIRKMADGSGGRFWAEDIVKALVNGSMQVWVVLIGAEIACVCVTDIHQYPRVRALRLLGVVGKGFRRWAHLLDHVEAWGRARGCQISEALLAGAKWMAMMPGYRMDHLRVVKAL